MATTRPTSSIGGQLPTPTFTAAAGDSQVTLNCTNASTYTLHVDYAANSTWPASMTTDSSYTNNSAITGLTNGTTYRFDMTFVDEFGNTSVPATVTAAPAAVAGGKMLLLGVG